MTTPDIASLPAILRDRAKVSELRGHHHAQWSEGVRFAANQVEAALASPAGEGGPKYSWGADGTVLADFTDDPGYGTTPEQPGSAVQGEAVALDRYDAGLLSDFGGGNVEWWQDYLRSELERAHDFYQSQFTTPPPAPAAEQGDKRLRHSCETDMLSDCPACTADLAATQPEARGVEGMDMLERMAADWESIADNTGFNDGYREACKHHASAVRNFLAATPNPVRAEQPEGKGAALDDLAQQMARFPMLAVIRALEKVAPGIRGAFAPLQAAPGAAVGVVTDGIPTWFVSCSRGWPAGIEFSTQDAAIAHIAENGGGLHFWLHQANRKDYTPEEVAALAGKDGA